VTGTFSVTSVKMVVLAKLAAVTTIFAARMTVATLAFTVKMVPADPPNSEESMGVWMFADVKAASGDTRSLISDCGLEDAK
jgi:hypothetical protein